MTVVDQVNADIVVAMRNRDAARLSALRMLKAALINRSVEAKVELDDTEARRVAQQLIKQRRDAIEQFRQAGRDELAAKEEAEIVVLASYLPPAASESEVDAAIDAAVAETGASSMKDLGRVMKSALARLAGKTVDGKLVSERARARLGG
jgi:uncharacterized protein YqeY